MTPPNNDASEPGSPEAGTPESRSASEDWGVREFQERIEEVYGTRDRARGVAGTFLWFTEEVGELARSLNSGTPGSLEEAREFADVFAWLSTLASMRGIDLATAAREKYGAGCPRCQSTPCDCSHRHG